jgi:hypothetical protein
LTLPDALQPADLQSLFPPDAVEQRLSDASAAVAMLRERRPDLIQIMAVVGESFLQHFGQSYLPLLERTQRALALSFVRMAYRHGSWGEDFHAYHNEEHTLELLNGRLARVRLQLGWGALAAEEWLMLAMFSTCHDLRQREEPHFVEDVGANERASMAECARVLALAGFDTAQHAEFYDSLALMIAGSTFDARPVPASSAEAASSGGSLSLKLAQRFEQSNPGWRSDPILSRRQRAILLSSDLDTANVGEPFLALARSAERLIREREMRLGRSLEDSTHSAGVLEFLTDGQERYFFKLHRFVSEPGRAVFGLGKTINAPKLKLLTDGLRDSFSGQAKASGERIVQRFIAIAEALI